MIHWTPALIYFIGLCFAPVWGKMVEEAFFTKDNKDYGTKKDEFDFCMVMVAYPAVFSLVAEGVWYSLNL